MRRSPGRVRVALALCAGLMLSNTAVAGPFDKVAGDWQGQAEFRASLGGEDDAAAYGIYDLVIRIEPGGKVFSGRVDNGCRFLGLLNPYLSNFQIQGQMSGCEAGSLNGRYSGEVLRSSAESITFRLRLSEVRVTRGDTRQANVASTMIVR